MLTENQIAKIVVNSAFYIHEKLGPGLFESVYETILAHKLSRLGLAVEKQKLFPVTFEGIKFEQAFRADIVVENKVILELKSVPEISKAHQKQLLTYLRVADMRLGLLINFGEAYFKECVHRIANGLEE
jgi:GxxExxY protein